ncbi:MAG: response regulator, partial [Flavobacteriaceae bacterium]|nr:response regulator [Flavobacteriaceae bacterium]
KYIDQLKGSISLRSKINEGSVFMVRLPISNKAKILTLNLPHVEKHQVELDKIHLPHINLDYKKGLCDVLLVEDNPDVLYYITNCLSSCYNVFMAQSGEEGFKLAKEFMPDVIITDVMMPGMDGYQLCSKLKTDYRTDHIPIIILTAKADYDSRLFGIKVGADAYLKKPFQEEELKGILDRIIQSRDKLIQKSKDEVQGDIIIGEACPKLTFISKVNKVIIENLNIPNFSIKNLEKETALCNSQLNKKLKSITGYTAVQYVNVIRLKRAKLLLENTDKQIAEVAFEVGFSDPSYFTKAFKKEFGYVPSVV